MYQVVNGRQLDGGMLVGQQADGAIIVGGSHDGDGHAWRIDIDIAGGQRQFITVIDNREPALDDQRERVGREESLYNIGTEGDVCISLGAVHLTIPIIYRHSALHGNPAFF